MVRPPLPERRCPTGCGRVPRPLQLMCPQCWAGVPAALQRDVVRTFRAWWGDRGDTAKLNAYEQAADAATEAVTS